MQTFDLLKSPLSGTNLIEASAGTGKTYTIEGLFVRLILERQLLVDQILVVTFTNAATEELKDRIRCKLFDAKNAFISRSSEDRFLNRLVQDHNDPQGAIQLIHDALINFDTAAIYTIHGFCQRVLYENAFETGSLFDTQLVTDQNEVIQEVIDDFWRKHFYEAPMELVNYAIPKLKGPQEFFRILSSVKATLVNVIPELAEPSLKNLKPFQNAYQQLTRKWLDSRETVIQILKTAALDGRQYGTQDPDPQMPTMTKRDLKILTLAESMNQCLNSMHSGFPLFKDFEKFTASYLSQKTKKNQTGPQHEFFDICDRVYRCGAALEADIDLYLLYLKTQIFSYANTELTERKNKKNINFFDDLLLQVNTALAGSQGRVLAETVRAKFKAALVDEFQDTDNVQYEIFTTLFSSKDHLLFMIGDPKQAIYGFRGADIFSYLEASRNAASKFTLLKNWRSAPGLITAVNTIFSNAKHPFIFEEIPFKKGKPGKVVTFGDKKPPAPLTVWYLQSESFYEEERFITKKEAVPFIAAAVAEEILDIILPGPMSVAPKDIAVLVRSNRQAQIVKHYLSAKGIPSVLHSTGNIFETREAGEIETILTAVSEPANVSHLKAALVMDCMGVNGVQLMTADQNPAWWEQQLSHFQEYHRIWEHHGFIRMFRIFSETEHLKERLLTFPDGERRLTNILHLSELLHQASIEKRLGITGLIKWLAEQRESSASEIEMHQLRLESDAQAVRIVTVHKSKGLEYPVVFCPFAWESQAVKSNEVVFHDRNRDMHLTLDLGSQKQKDHLILSQNERLAEDLRLFYVALTRAQQRCYFVWGKINAADTSAMAYLLYAGEMGKTLGDSGRNITAALKAHIAARTEAEILTDLELLARQSKGTIRVQPTPSASDRTFIPLQEQEDYLLCRKFQGKIDRSWKISSYSSLVSAPITDIDLPDHDIHHTATGQTLELLLDNSTLNKGSRVFDIFSFPKGARAGIFFHDIFEHIDFQEPLDEGVRSLVDQKIEAYGFEKSWHQTIFGTIANVLNTPLPPERNDFRLTDIGVLDRINEMEFYFPLNPVTPNTFQEIFKSEAGVDLELDFPQQLEKLTFAPTAGFMKGYIDMLFRHDAKFYLVDWKSNYLGSTYESYNQEALIKTMHENFYTLQYHLYTLALYQYLQRHKPDFNYNTDFGGVFYIFIRGVGDPHNPTCGVYQDFPSPVLINRLGRVLIPGF